MPGFLKEDGRGSSTWKEKKGGLAGSSFYQHFRENIQKIFCCIMNKIDKILFYHNHKTKAGIYDHLNSVNSLQIPLPRNWGGKQGGICKIVFFLRKTLRKIFRRFTPDEKKGVSVLNSSDFPPKPYKKHKIINLKVVFCRNVKNFGNLHQGITRYSAVEM
jgi:hypothetical protein